MPRLSLLYATLHLSEQNILRYVLAVNVFEQYLHSEIISTPLHHFRNIESVTVKGKTGLIDRNKRRVTASVRCAALFEALALILSCVLWPNKQNAMRQPGGTVAGRVVHLLHSLAKTAIHRV